jgi:DNA-binding response OmpR family regulator
VDLSFANTGICWRLECEAGEVSGHGSPSQKPADGTHAQSQARPRILVVEDETLLALEIAEVLKECGFEVAGLAASVSRSLELFGSKGCDAAVLDVKLGQETSEPVALELVRRGIPFVILSGYARHQFPPVFNAAPALTKPMRPGPLVAALRICLKGQATTERH